MGFEWHPYLPVTAVRSGALTLLKPVIMVSGGAGQGRVLMRFLNFIGVILLGTTMAACDSEIVNHPPGSDRWMDGNPGQFAEFAANAEEGPVAMLNLLKFKDQSSGGEGTGAEAYARYAELAGPFVLRYGGELVWAGEAREQLVGDMAYDWDAVLLVKWPARQNLIDLGRDEEYQAISHHRKKGLERTMLIALDQTGGMLVLPEGTDQQ